MPLSWGTIPTGTHELALFVFHTTPHGLVPDWGMVGLKPALSGIAAGSLPQGTVTGRDSQGHDGYSVCPGKGQSLNYGILLFALPGHVSARPGFDPSQLLKQVEAEAKAEGLLRFSYRRA